MLLPADGSMRLLFFSAVIKSVLFQNLGAWVEEFHGVQIAKGVSMFPKDEMDRINYNAALTACARASQWHHALQLLASMRGEEIRPDIVSFSIAWGHS